MKSFSREISLKTSRLSRSNLLELEKLMLEGVILNELSGILAVSTDVDGTNIYDWGVENFLKHPELPNILEQLSIRVYGKDMNGESISIDAVFYTNYSTISIRGNSETLVTGKAVLINNFLITKRHKFWFFQTNVGYVFEGMLGAIGIGTLGFILPELFYNPHFDTDYVPVFVFILSAYIFLYAINKIPFNQIYLKDKSSPLSRNDVLTIIFGVIATAGVIWQIFGPIFY